MKPKPQPPAATPKARAMPKARRLICKSCNGSGRIDDHVEPVRRCDDCVGRGYYHAKVKAPVVQKARVLYVHPERLIPGKKQLIAMRASQFGAGTDGIVPVPVPVLVRPYRTKQQAQGAAKWARKRYKTKMAALKALFPSNWTDLILTGPNATLKGAGGTWGCPDVERLIQAIRDDVTARILQLLGERPEGDSK